MGIGICWSRGKRCVVTNNAGEVDAEIASLFAEELAGVGGGFAFVFVFAVDENVDALF